MHRSGKSVRRHNEDESRMTPIWGQKGRITAPNSFTIRTQSLGVGQKDHSMGIVRHHSKALEAVEAPLVQEGREMQRRKWCPCPSHRERCPSSEPPSLITARDLCELIQLLELLKGLRGATLHSNLPRTFDQR